MPTLLAPIDSSAPRGAPAHRATLVSAFTRRDSPHAARSAAALAWCWGAMRVLSRKENQHATHNETRRAHRRGGAVARRRATGARGLARRAARRHRAAGALRDHGVLGHQPRGG